MNIKIGTIVRGKHSKSKTGGLYGKVLSFDEDVISVEWERDIGGHRGMTGNGKKGHCWNVLYSDVEILSCSVR